MKKILFILAMVVVPVAAFAGTGGTEFTEIWNTILGWTQGFLGKTLALGAFLTGIAIGVVRQSLMSIALGLGAAMAVYYTPDIINNIVAALL
jgi:conjugal transfer pilus assembly protein TraA